MVERIWEVVKRGCVGEGGFIRIRASEGSRLWERIWDSTANYIAFRQSISRATENLDIEVLRDH